MELKHLDTSRLKYNPKSDSFVKKISGDIPEFKKYRPRVLDREKVFSYVVLLYDFNTPVTYEVLDYYQKKSAVADMLGFAKGEDDKWEDKVEEMLLGLDERVNELIVVFVARFGMPEYTKKVAYTVMLQRETIKALGRGANKDTLANIEKLTAYLGEIDRKLYQSGTTDEITIAKKALYAQVERDRIKIRPEDIVEIIEATKGILPKEFDQYPSEDEKGKRIKKPVSVTDTALHFYNESKEEKEQRKKEEKDAQI